jgi:hypothetical protein
MNSTTRSPGDQLVDTLHRAKYHFSALVAAIHTGSYFDAWLSAMLFRTALDGVTQLGDMLSGNGRMRATLLSSAMRSTAEPVLALAPSPGRDDIRRLGISDPDRRQRAWQDLEEHWRHAIRCTCTDRGGLDLDQPN